MLSPDTGVFIQQHARIDPASVCIAGSERASVEVQWRTEGRWVPGPSPSTIGPTNFIFIQFSAKMGFSSTSDTPGRLGNSGSATGIHLKHLTWFYLNIFTEFSDKNVVQRLFEPATFCVIDYDVTTEPAKHM